MLLSLSDEDELLLVSVEEGSLPELLSAP